MILVFRALTRSIAAHLHTGAQHVATAPLDIDVRLPLERKLDAVAQIFGRNQMLNLRGKGRKRLLLADLVPHSNRIGRGLECFGPRLPLMRPYEHLKKEFVVGVLCRQCLVERQTRDASGRPIGHSLALFVVGRLLDPHNVVEHQSARPNRGCDGRQWCRHET